MEDAIPELRNFASLSAAGNFTITLPNFASASDRRARMPGSPAGRMPAPLGPGLYHYFTFALPNFTPVLGGIVEAMTGQSNRTSNCTGTLKTP